MKNQTKNKTIIDLNEAEQEVLSKHKEYSTTSQIVEDCKYSNSYVKRIKRKLENLELIEVTGRDGLSFEYSLTDKGKELVT